LSAQAKEASATSGVPVESKVVEGNIFEDIGGMAATIDAKLIIMGTHGAKGLQKVTGSYALKVITNSDVPFVVVQKREILEHGYKKIVMPLDLLKESTQQLRIASELARYFRSEIHIFGKGESDPFMANKVKANILVAKKFLKKEGASSTVSIGEGKSSFDKEVLDYPTGIGADLISIVNIRESLFSMFGGFEQHIIANALEIPALIMNPRQQSKMGNYLFV
ncbi:MAG: universal stress protein, partial [Bacteroidota bacterium]